MLCIYLHIATSHHTSIEIRKLICQNTKDFSCVFFLTNICGSLYQILIYFSRSSQSVREEDSV